MAISSMVKDTVIRQVEMIWGKILSLSMRMIWLDQGAGRAETGVNAILNLLKYWFNSFSTFNNLSERKSERVIRENNDTIYSKIYLRSGYWTTTYKVKDKNDKDDKNKK